MVAVVHGLVRRTTTPFVRRSCVLTQGGFTWIETVPESSVPYCTPVDALDGVRAALSHIRHDVRYPEPSGDPTSARWSSLGTPQLLCDLLFAGPEADSAGLCLTILGRMAEVIAIVHSCDVSGLTPLPVRVAPAWLSESEVRSAHRRAAVLLPWPHGSRVVEIARRVPEPGSPALIHGRFSSGQITGSSAPVLMGWRDAGFGDPGIDLAFLISEIVESVLVTGSATTAGALIRSFYGTYRRLRRYPAHRLVPLVARRLIEHQAQAAMVHGRFDHRVADDLRIIDSTFTRLAAVLEMCDDES